MPRAVISNAREGYMCVGAIVCGHPAGELETMACVFIECSFGLNTAGPEKGGRWRLNSPGLLPTRAMAG